MIVFITTYALEQGIIQTEADATPDAEKIWIVRDPDDPRGLPVCPYWKPDWHLTREAAVMQANKMRLDRLTELDKERQRLLALKFE